MGHKTRIKEKCTYLISSSPFLFISKWHATNIVFWMQLPTTSSCPADRVTYQLVGPVQDSVSQSPYPHLEWLVHNIFYISSEIQRMSYQTFKEVSRLSVMAPPWPDFIVSQHLCIYSKMFLNSILLPWQHTV